MSMIRRRVYSNRFNITVLIVFFLLFPVLPVDGLAEAGKGKGLETQQEKLPQQFVITQILVRGNRYMSEKRIIKLLGLSFPSEVTGSDLQKAITNLYETGYFADIDIRLVPAPLPEGFPEKLKAFKLILVVSENPIIKRIVFIGNALLSRGELLELMETRPGKLLNYKILQGDIKRINQEYEQMGYVGVRTHVKDIKFDPDGTLYIKIVEGLLVREIEVIGAEVVPVEKVRKLIKVKLGKYLKRDDIRDSLKAISELYQEEGYLLFDVRAVPDEEKGKVTFQLIEGVLEDIEVKGLKRTKPYVVIKQLGLPKGEVVDLNLLKRGIRRLTFSGLFKDVKADFKSGSRPGKVILVLDLVEEPKTGQVMLSAALAGKAGENRGGLAGALSVSEVNYKGKGQKIFAQWQRGNLISQLTFSFWDYYSDPRGIIWGFSYFDTKFHYQRIPVSSEPLHYAYYVDDRKGGTFYIGKRSLDNRRTWLVSLTRYSIYTTPQTSETNPYMIPYIIHGHISSIGATYTIDTRDDEFFPTRGRYDTFSIEQGLKLLGDYTYTKFQVDLKRYWKFNKNVLAMRLLAGIASDDIPFTSMFVMGGPDTLKAYNYNTFMGNKMFLTTIEYRFPIFKKEEFHGAIFVDYGKAFMPDEKFSFSDMKLDYGVGIMFTLPSFGLIRLDYATSDEDRRLVVRVGETF